MAQNSKLIGDILIHAKLTNVSPLVMGAQEGEETNLEILKHSNGKPYVSGTAFGGKLLRYFSSDNSKIIDQNLKYLLGDGDDNQSHIIIDCLEFVNKDSEFSILINDSNKISKETGTTENKFDFEKLEPGNQFAFNAHIKIREDFNIDFFKDVVIFINTVFKDNFSIGAKTNNGYGLMCLDEFKAKVFDYSAANNSAFEEWENYLNTNIFENDFSSFKPTYFEYKSPNKVVFELNLAIKSQFITSETVIDTNDVDKVQSRRGDKYILKGEAAKNALSHRAYRILNTISGKNKKWVNPIMLYLFGEDLNDKLEHKPAHLKTKESIFKNVNAKKQTRIKISRFTGGTIDSAMVESMPIHSIDENKPNITLRFELRQEQGNLFSNSMTLMLHLIKDLFTEDLPIGGEKATGKGIMKGCESNIFLPNPSQIVRITNKGIEKISENFTEAHPLYPFNTFKLF